MPTVYCGCAQRCFKIVNPKNFGTSLSRILAAAHQEFLCVHSAVGSLLLRLASWRWPRCSWSVPLAGRYCPAPAGRPRSAISPDPGPPAACWGAAPPSTLPVVSALPVMLLWCLFLVGNAELVRRGRAHAGPSDLKYLLDPPDSSAAPPRAAASPTCRSALGLGATLLACCSGVACWMFRACRAMPTRAAGGVPWRRMSACSLRRRRCRPKWQQYNLPHKLLALSSGQLAVEDAARRRRSDTPPDVAGLKPARPFRNAAAGRWRTRAQRPDRGHGGNPGARRQPRRHPAAATTKRRCPG